MIDRCSLRRKDARFSVEHEMTGGVISKNIEKQFSQDQYKPLFKMWLLKCDYWKMAWDSDEHAYFLTFKVCVLRFISFGIVSCEYLGCSWNESILTLRRKKNQIFTSDKICALYRHFLIVRKNRQVRKIIWKVILMSFIWYLSWTQVPWPLGVFFREKDGKKLQSFFCPAKGCKKEINK